MLDKSHQPTQGHFCGLDTRSISSGTIIKEQQIIKKKKKKHLAYYFHVSEVFV